MTKRAKSIALHLVDGKKHLTKAEIEKRKAAEEAITNGTDKVKPPSWLCKVGKKEFRIRAKELLAIKLITNADVNALAVYCDTYADYLTCVQIIRDDKMMVDAKSGSSGPKGNSVSVTKNVPHPLLVKKRQLAEQLQKLGAEFGFTPSARAKIAMPKKEPKKKTAFEETFGNV